MLLFKILNPRSAISIIPIVTKPNLFQLFSKLAKILDILQVGKISPLKATVLMLETSMLFLMDKTVPSLLPVDTSSTAPYNQKKMRLTLLMLTKVEMEQQDTSSTLQRITVVAGLKCIILTNTVTLKC